MRALDRGKYAISALPGVPPRMLDTVHQAHVYLGLRLPEESFVRLYALISSIF